VLLLSKIAATYLSTGIEHAFVASPNQVKFRNSF
jgi:hypothetical protein